MKGKRLVVRLLIGIALAYMLCFSSCTDAVICWLCVNPLDSTQWVEVCNASSKNKWESYGYVCN